MGDLRMQAAAADARHKAEKFHQQWRRNINDCRIEAELIALLQRVAAYPTDPGTSDLDDEQPVHVTLELGDVWLAKQLVPRD